MRALAIALCVGLLILVGFCRCVKDDFENLRDDVQAYQTKSLLPDE